VEGTHGHGDGEGSGGKERNPCLVQRPERLFPGRSDPHAWLVQDHAQVHAHATARVQEQELYETESVCKMLSQPRKSVNSAQSFSTGMPKPRLHLVRHGHCGRSSATLPGRLRKDAEENVHGI